MSDEPIREDVELINTFLSVNNGKQSFAKSYIKAITAKVFGNVKSASAYLNNDEGGAVALSDIFNFEKGTIVQDRLNDFRTMSNSRYRQYGTYEYMAEDPIISSALDMYADDATQTDAAGDRIWVTGTDDKSTKILENIFNSLNIKKKIWKVARSLAQYGDVYLEIIYEEAESSDVTLLESYQRKSADYTRNITEVDSLTNNRQADSKNGRVIKDIRLIPDIQNMFDLQLDGKTVAFARLIESDSNYSSVTGYISPRDVATDIRYYPPDKFVHIFIDQSDKREVEFYTVNLDNGYQFRFEVARGKSMIHDIFRTHRDLQLLEYSIMLNRAARSSIFRFVQVEVGNMSKSNVDVTMRKVKNLIESKLTMNTNEDSFKPYSDPGPVENYLYIPVKNGQGQISVDTVGGDINIRDIADLEYYNNKLFAGLKIPKSFLNYEDVGSSLFNSGGALTKQDARYARTVKRLQSFIIEGVQETLTIFLINKGFYHLVPEMEIRMVTPSTVEDEERSELFNNRIELIKSLTEAISSLAESETVEIDMQKYIDYLSEEIMNDSVLKDVLTVNPGVVTKIEAPEAGSGFSPPEYGGGGTSSTADLDSVLSGTDDGSTSDYEDMEGTPVGAQFSGEWSDLNV